MYPIWDVARTEEMRAPTHRGAWCNPCLKHGVKKDPKGHFFAKIDAILTHVKECPHCDDADFQPNPNRVPLAVLFVSMPEFDVNLLFDEVIA